mmetsp:Transcript_87296/g.252084  ORF Transcript_87296/g.252084 Transcript_87296/m.252084 type:complete len:217 (+) Transcript_87296:474-1124(+)
MAQRPHGGRRLLWSAAPSHSASCLRRELREIHEHRALPGTCLGRCHRALHGRLPASSFGALPCRTGSPCAAPPAHSEVRRRPGAPPATRQSADREAATASLEVLRACPSLGTERALAAGGSAAPARRTGRPPTGTPSPAQAASASREALRGYRAAAVPAACLRRRLRLDAACRRRRRSTLPSTLPSARPAQDQWAALLGSSAHGHGEAGTSPAAAL